MNHTDKEFEDIISQEPDWQKAWEEKNEAFDNYKRTAMEVKKEIIKKFKHDYEDEDFIIKINQSFERLGL